ncbi:hypothetical protein WJ037_001664 [Neisseria gonorrhoeae]|uniref:hypothetical protein n=1 Tax=Neisseria gonorrhoeae TaxID=485 RepID=UPI001F4F0D90|nr:hypothetical protein [Neisseria gonorrhoeae]
MIFKCRPNVFQTASAVSAFSGGGWGCGVKLRCRRLSVLFNPGVMLFVPDCPVGGAAGFFQYEMLCPLFRQGRLQTGSNFAYDVFMSAGRLNGGRKPPRRLLVFLPCFAPLPYN